MIDLTEPEKLDLRSMNTTEEQKSKLKQIFPHVFNEDKIDFDKLRQTLGEEIDEGQERYDTTWPGKTECFRIIQQSSLGTLKPIREESANFDTTENLFIEGDNLEVLKILQNSYYGKIKMIYIDPPYNTGKEFIYPDKYSETLDTYLAYTGQVNNEGIKFSTNTEVDGRFHSKWLNMMYPRLFLARNLLRDDGVIFISIDDHEVANVRKICDEIFGEENFEGSIHWRRRHNQPNDPTKMIGIVAEYIIAYAKDKRYYKQCGVGKLELTGDFSNPDNDPRGDWASKPWKTGSDQSGSRYIITTPTGKILDEEWMGEEATFKALVEDNRIFWPKKGDGSPRKKYFKYERESEGQCATNWWSHECFGHNQGANDEMTKLMGIKNVFSNPKPTTLIKSLISISNVKDGDIVLDFFAGSCSTFQAATEFDANISCICVQLPELLDEENKDQKTGYEFCKSNSLKPTIAEIGKERIRRMIKKIEDEHKQNSSQKTLFDADSKVDLKKLDLGFKVFKLDKSNFNQWDGSIEIDTKGEKIIKQLQLAIENINPKSSEEDILYELLLKSGFSLTTRIEEIELAGKKVYSIENDALLICLSRELSKEVITEMARKEPARVICLDDGFAGNDQLKTNAVQIMRSFGVEDFRTV